MGLVIDIFDFRFELAIEARAPLILKPPELPLLWLLSNPSASAETEFKPFMLNAVAAVPVWEVAMKFEIFSDVKMFAKQGSNLGLMGF